MPNTKSAERRVRNSARKHQRNQATKSNLKTLEKRFLATTTATKKEDAVVAYKAAAASLDKAAKSGVIPKGRADRKKSRLALRLKAVK
jgi:small subunit ribosomal protein S20